MKDTRRPFSEVELDGISLWDVVAKPPRGLPLSLAGLLYIADFIHIMHGLIQPYSSKYPLVEPRELIPSFDAPLIEYKNLPAFSMVMLDRQLSYQDEGFQFDMLWFEGQPTDAGVVAQNRQAFRQRLPRDVIPAAEQVLGRKAITPLKRYPELLPFMLKMDRGHVMARNPLGYFHLTGIFASFPSDLDGEIKRFGRQIEKFTAGDNSRYAANREFVYQFLMEQLGFPICGERHTSAALFARRLMRRRESYAVKVLGTSDRTITTLTSQGARQGLPRVEKTALVAAESCSKECSQRLADEGFYLDPKRKVVILKVRYAQHAYHPNNVLEDRALSVAGQEVIHPLTGKTLEVDILGLSQDRLLMLNDIVRGEFEGSIVFQGREQVQGTADMASRLKFLAAWLKKHRALLSDYSPDNFERVRRVLGSFLEEPDHQEEFQRHPLLSEEVSRLMDELRVDHRLRLLEKLVENLVDASGRRLQHVHVLIILVHVLGHEGPNLAERHPKYLRKLLSICRKELEKPYLRSRYLSSEPETAVERELVGEHRLLSHMVERFEEGLDGD